MTTEVTGNDINVTLSDAADAAWRHSVTTDVPGFAMSESIAKLVKALAAAQGEMVDPVKDRENPHYKQGYTTLVACTSAYRPVLSKHGLALTQWHLGDRLVSLLAHESGEWIRGVGPINPTKNDPQGIASATTYARRYASMAIVGLAPADDDDGNAASQKPESTPKKPSAKPKPTVSPDVGEAKKALLADFTKARGPASSSLSDTQVLNEVAKQLFGGSPTTLDQVAEMRAALLVNRDFDLDEGTRIPGSAGVGK